jgi:hypothetical protein
MRAQRSCSTSNSARHSSVKERTGWLPRINVIPAAALHSRCPEGVINCRQLSRPARRLLPSNRTPWWGRRCLLLNRHGAAGPSGRLWQGRPAALDRRAVEVEVVEVAGLVVARSRMAETATWPGRKHLSRQKVVCLWPQSLQAYSTRLCPDSAETRLGAPHLLHLTSIRVLPCVIGTFRAIASFTKRSDSSRIASFDIAGARGFLT